ncbi:MAG: trypsin-like serine protease [Thermoflexaceae bacterium]|nr:trypsin-like serine protease [Thermoflexaceae bacterium]
MASVRTRRAHSRAALALACAALALLGLAALTLAPGDAAGAPPGAAQDEPHGRVFRGDGVHPAFDREAERARIEGGASAQSVIGSDERVQLTNTHEYPLRAIAFLGLYDKAGEFVGHCTGTFISPNALLTAAHCLWSAETGWTWDIRVVPGRNGDVEPYDYEWAKDFWVPDGWIDSEEGEDWDWGVIQMSSNALGNTVGWFSIGVLRGDTLRQPDFAPAIIGYAGDKPFGTLWGHYTNAFTSVGDSTLTYTVDTSGGESGSAVFSLNSNKYYYGYIVGIHVRGGTNANEGSRIDMFLLNDLLKGCAAMGCTVDWESEAQTGPTPTPTRSATATPTRTPTPPATATPTRTPAPSVTQPPRGDFRLRMPILAADR